MAELIGFLMRREGNPRLDSPINWRKFVLGKERICRGLVRLFPSGA